MKTNKYTAELRTKNDAELAQALTEAKKDAAENAASSQTTETGGEATNINGTPQYTISFKSDKNDETSKFEIKLDKAAEGDTEYQLLNYSKYKFK